MGHFSVKREAELLANLNALYEKEVGLDKQRDPLYWKRFKQWVEYQPLGRDYPTSAAGWHMRSEAAIFMATPAGKKQIARVARMRTKLVARSTCLRDVTYAVALHLNVPFYSVSKAFSSYAPLTEDMGEAIDYLYDGVWTKSKNFLDLDMMTTTQPAQAPQPPPAPQALSEPPPQARTTFMEFRELQLQRRALSKMKDMITKGYGLTYEEARDILSLAQGR